MYFTSQNFIQQYTTYMIKKSSYKNKIKKIIIMKTLISMIFRRLFLVILSLSMLSLFSCKEEEVFQTSKMQDGTVITTRKIIRYYETEDDFINAIRYPSAYDTYQDGEIINNNYNLNDAYTIIGTSKEENYQWEMAKFGEWIKKYGFEPNELYYICSTVYLRYTSLPPEGCYFVNKYEYGEEEDMGYEPNAFNIKIKNFSITYDKNNSVSIFTTCGRTIGYDKNGNIINESIPKLANIKWKFQVLKNFWL